MKKSTAALEEAEAFVRKALSHVSDEPVNKKAIKLAAQKVAKAMPVCEERKTA
jgi:hypothetical protein